MDAAGDVGASGGATAGDGVTGERVGAFGAETGGVGVAGGVVGAGGVGGWVTGG